jgi:Ca2+/Na+ antiporter
MQGVIDFIVKIWNWFNGNKTVIGLVLLQVASMVPEGVNVFGLFDLKAGLIWLGNFFGGVGILHKIAKANFRPEPTA